MNRRVYRICLIMIIAAAVVSGIFYYRFTQKREIAPSEGIFVWQIPYENTYAAYVSSKEPSSGDTYMTYVSNKELSSGDTFKIYDSYKEVPVGDTFVPYGNNKEIPARDAFVSFGNNQETAGSEWI